MPEVIAHFKVLGSLGAGGLGEVYRARDTRLGRTVAIKVLPETITRDPRRFDALGDLALRLTTLSHPNITTIFEGGQDGEQRYLVFEYVQGEPLKSLVTSGPLNIRRALDFAINLADGLADAHGAGFIHGDIRPDTIVVTPKDRAKFMNFGLSAFTTGGTNRLNPPTPYVSPEELEGKPADARSDIYSLGAVLFETVTGRPRARGLVASGINSHVPPELDQILGRMLASNVEHRCQNAATIAAELRSLAAIVDTRTEAAEAASRPPRTKDGGRRNGVGIALVLLVAIAAIAAWMLL